MPSQNGRRPELGSRFLRDLEALLLGCLAKSPADRPRDAAELLCKLNACAIEGAWTADDAGAWWAAREPWEGNDEVAALATMDLASGRQSKPTPDATIAYEGDTRR